MRRDCLAWTAIVVAIGTLLVPAFLASERDAECLNFPGFDYERNRCGSRMQRRDLDTRPFLYWLQPHNISSGVCVRSCPRLADELMCDYGYDSASIAVQRAQLGKRCFGQHRTRAIFLTCFPSDPLEVGLVDVWLSSHSSRQLTSDALQSSGILFNVWVLAVLAALALAIGMRWLPLGSLFVVLISALALSILCVDLLLPAGTSEVGDLNLALEQSEAVSAREVSAAHMLLAAGDTARPHTATRTH